MDQSDDERIVAARVAEVMGAEKPRPLRRRLGRDDVIEAARAYYDALDCGHHGAAAMAARDARLVLIRRARERSGLQREDLAFVAEALHQAGDWAEAESEALHGPQEGERMPSAGGGVSASRPVIVCLCGSTRFTEAWRAANLRETLAGRIVLTVGCDTKSDANLALDDATKARLDELHKRKIDLADEVLILNVGGYIGASTRSELAYAEAAGKRVRWLEEP